MLEFSIDGKNYALVPLCTFHDIEPTADKFRSEIVKETFGMLDKNFTFSVFEITDPKKVMLARIKYGM